MEKNAGLAKIIARAWADDSFKKKLLSDPNAALKEAGVDVPAGVEFKVHEDVPGKVHHIILPQKPGSGELSEEDLASAAGGGSTSVKMSVKGLTTK